MKRLILRPDVIEAVREFNIRKYGRGVSNKPDITDQEVIERLEALAFPGEDLNDTILRTLNQGGSAIQ